MSIKLRTPTEIGSSVDLALEDVLVRFIINCPAEDRSTVERLFFQIEEGHWYYLDFLKTTYEDLPNYKLKAFSAKIIQYFPSIWKWSEFSYEEALKLFGLYKATIPVRGAIILSNDMKQVLLVRGMGNRSRWGFPRGKINKDEPDEVCAAREVDEEIGVNVYPLISPKDYIERDMLGKNYKYYIVTGLPEDSSFAPKARNEISQIAWHKISSLNSNNAHLFMGVLEVENQLKKWIRNKTKAKKQKSKNNKANSSKNSEIVEQEAVAEQIAQAQLQLKALLGLPVNKSPVTSKDTKAQTVKEPSKEEGKAVLLKMLSKPQPSNREEESTEQAKEESKEQLKEEPKEEPKTTTTTSPPNLSQPSFNPALNGPNGPNGMSGMPYAPMGFPMMGGINPGSFPTGPLPPNVQMPVFPVPGMFGFAGLPGAPPFPQGPQPFPNGPNGVPKGNINPQFPGFPSAHSFPYASNAQPVESHQNHSNAPSTSSINLPPTLPPTIAPTPVQEATIASMGIMQLPDARSFSKPVFALQGRRSAASGNGNNSAALLSLLKSSGKSATASDKGNSSPENVKAEPLESPVPSRAPQKPAVFLSILERKQPDQISKPVPESSSSNQPPYVQNSYNPPAEVPSNTSHVSGSRTTPAIADKSASSQLLGILNRQPTKTETQQEAHQASVTFDQGIQQQTGPVQSMYSEQSVATGPAGNAGSVQVNQGRDDSSSQLSAIINGAPAAPSRSERKASAAQTLLGILDRKPNSDASFQPNTPEYLVSDHNGAHIQPTPQSNAETSRKPNVLLDILHRQPTSTADVTRTAQGANSSNSQAVQSSAPNAQSGAKSLLNILKKSG